MRFSPSCYHRHILHIALDRHLALDVQPASEWEHVSRAGEYMRGKALLRSLTLVIVAMLLPHQSDTWLTCYVFDEMTLTECWMTR